MNKSTKRILVILGHPGQESFCRTIFENYLSGARESGAEVRQLDLIRLQFDPILREGYRKVQGLEPDLAAAQEAILWANHLVIIYPVWWGSIPALLKGFIDRVFLPGYAFKYRPDSSLWDKLLQGRTARLITTSGSPNWWIRLVYRNSDYHMMKSAVLGFCGISPVKITRFGSVRGSRPENRQVWLDQVKALGRKLG